MWYDEKLLEKDLEREREAKRKIDIEGGVSTLLENWKQEQGNNHVEVVDLKERKKDNEDTIGSMEKKSKKKKKKNSASATTTSKKKKKKVSTKKKQRKK